MKKLLLFLSLVLICSQMLAEKIYIRTNADDTSWNAITDGVVITLDEGDLLTGSQIGTDMEVYLAPGTYKVNSLIVTENGKIYGGFSGQESNIDLDSRLREDKDGNSIAEPWEFAHEAIITTSNPDYKFTNIGVSNGTRLLVVSGINAEVNGITFTDFHYTNFAGPICIGAQSATLENNTIENKGLLKYCIIKRIKADMNPNNFSGILMSTNKYSLIQQCLIQDNVMDSGQSGGAVFFNQFGGKVSGCVIRNNTAQNGRGGGIWATSIAGYDMDAIVENCVVYNNYAGRNGGAVRGEAQANKAGIQIVNSTIVNNFTGGTSSYSVELINSGVLVNSIIGKAARDIRANTSNHYLLNSAYGVSSITSPNPANSGNIVINSLEDFIFVSPTTFEGVMIPDYTPSFDANKYEAIQKANFNLSSTESLAATTSGIKSLPPSYTFSTYTIPISATIPTIDLLGKERIGSFNLDIGAYQLSSLSTQSEMKHSETNKVFSKRNSIVIYSNTGEEVSIYDMTGTLMFLDKNSSGQFDVACSKGTYIVKIGKQNTKVVVY